MVNKNIRMFKADGDVVRMFKESEQAFEGLKRSVDKRIRGDSVSYQIINEIKKISDAINLAKSLSRRLQSLFPVNDTANEIRDDLSLYVTGVLDTAFENLDSLESKWKDQIQSYKGNIHSDWFGPFTEDQTEEVLKLRYLGHSYEDIAEMLNVKNVGELQKMVDRWIVESK
jgi:hypothetical protein